jgi:hypothetical protein
MADLTFELDVPAGLNSDDTTFGAKGRWADGSNVRFRNGRPETIGRIVRILGSGATTAVPNVNALFAYLKSTTTIPYIIGGGSSALYSSSGSATGFTDITPAALTNASYWTFDTWGDTLLAAPGGGGLYTTDGGTTAAIVATAPASIMYMMATSQRQVLALGCNEEVSTTFNPMCIRGSDLEDYTNWTTSPTNNAFEHILEGEGKIIAGRRIGAYIAVWTNAALYLGQFIGDPSQTYRFDLVSGGCGLVGHGAAEVLNGVAYWMSPDHRFYRWTPGELPQQIPCPIGLELQTSISASTSRTDTLTRAVRLASFGEIWWFYPDTRDSSARRYVAFNTVDGTWFRGVLDRRAVFHGDFLYNPAATSGVRPWRPFISADSSGAIYSHEVETFGGNGDGVAAVDCYLQSADQYLNSGQTRVMVSRAIPDFEAQTGDVSLTLFMRDRPQSTAVTKGPYTLTATTTKKDFRASGMIMAAKLSSTGQQWRLGKPVFDMVPMGGR